MKSNCEFRINGDDVTIYRRDRNEIMFTTYRTDYWEELSSQTWRINKQGYPESSKLGTLHRYIMGKWYGEEVLAELTSKGYVVDHLDNDHNNCTISNLEFLKKDYNTSKGQWLDKQTKELKQRFALAIYKDFRTNCYQITIGMNDPVVRKDEEGEHFVGSVKFLYTSDYPIVIKDAEMMLLDLERVQFNPEKYNAVSIRVYDCPTIELTEDEMNKAVVMREGKTYAVIGNGMTYIYKIAPDRDWMPPERGKKSYQIFKMR